MFSCVITAGGKGSRFDCKQKKQFYRINHKTIIEHTILLFAQICEVTEIIIAAPGEDIEFIKQELKDLIQVKLIFVEGGKTRQESVYNALKKCTSINKYVVIHDAVRPFAKLTDIYKLMYQVKLKKAVIAGSTIKNTIKKTKNDLIIETIERSDVIEVYTPQVFELDLIRQYHALAVGENQIFTDDAGILEYYNIPVYWIETDSRNIKITTKEDLSYAEYLFNKEINSGK